MFGAFIVSVILLALVTVVIGRSRKYVTPKTTKQQAMDDEVVTVTLPHIEHKN